MATKTTARKSTSSKSASVAKKNAASASKLSGIKNITKEANPENHVVTGKFVFFYVFFAVAMVIFAGLSVLFYVTASQLEADMEELKSCYVEDANCSLPNKPAEKNNNNSDSTEYYNGDTAAENASELAE